MCCQVLKVGWIRSIYARFLIQTPLFWLLRDTTWEFETPYSRGGLSENGRYTHLMVDRVMWKPCHGYTTREKKPVENQSSACLVHTKIYQIYHLFATSLGWKAGRIHRLSMFEHWLPSWLNIFDQQRWKNLLKAWTHLKNRSTNLGWPFQEMFDKSQKSVAVGCF